MNASCATNPNCYLRNGLILVQGTSVVWSLFFCSWSQERHFSLNLSGTLPFSIMEENYQYCAKQCISVHAPAQPQVIAFHCVQGRELCSITQSWVQVMNGPLRNGTAAWSQGKFMFILGNSRKSGFFWLPSWQMGRYANTFWKGLFREKDVTSPE